MLRVDRTNKLLIPLAQKTLPEAGWKEREDLQQLIRKSPEVFFAEMGEELLLVGEELRPDDVVDDRIDLLALDSDGAAVVIELKRGSHKLHLLQAITYAAMVSKWDYQKFVGAYQEFTRQSMEETEEEIAEFVPDSDLVNSRQRIILIAENFDYSVLVSAEWLTNFYELDIRCYRLSVSVDGGAEYMSCTCIYPPTETASHAIDRKSRISRRRQWGDWETALESITNPDVVTFFRSQLSAGCDNYLRKRYLYFSPVGKRQIFVSAKRNHAYVWQERRFEKDESYWADKIGNHIKVESKKRGTCLSFYLSKNEDFQNFLDAVNNDLPNMDWYSRGEVPELDETEPGED